jgi:hypothetical protein
MQYAECHFPISTGTHWIIMGGISPQNSDLPFSTSKWRILLLLFLDLVYINLSFYINFMKIKHACDKLWSHYSVYSTWNMEKSLFSPFVPIIKLDDLDRFLNLMIIQLLLHGFWSSIARFLSFWEFFNIHEAALGVVGSTGSKPF